LLSLHLVLNFDRIMPLCLKFASVAVVLFAFINTQSTNNPTSAPITACEQDGRGVGCGDQQGTPFNVTQAPTPASGADGRSPSDTLAPSTDGTITPAPTAALDTGRDPSVTQRPSTATSATPTADPVDHAQDTPFPTTYAPTRPGETRSPTSSPTDRPTALPTTDPTEMPTTSNPTEMPTWNPTKSPTQEGEVKEETTTVLLDNQDRDGNNLAVQNESDGLATILFIVFGILVFGLCAGTLMYLCSKRESSKDVRKVQSVQFQFKERLDRIDSGSVNQKINVLMDSMADGPIAVTEEPGSGGISLESEKDVVVVDALKAEPETNDKALEMLMKSKSVDVEDIDANDESGTGERRKQTDGSNDSEILADLNVSTAGNGDEESQSQ